MAGQAEDGKKRRGKIQALRGRDIVLTDEDAQHGRSGLAALVSRELPDTKIIFISGYNDVHY